jgi:hypothetical protein
MEFKILGKWCPQMTSSGPILQNYEVSNKLYDIR